MAKYTIEDTTLTNIANSIREKTGKSEKLLPSQMPNEIKSIESGSSPSQTNLLVEFTSENESIFPKKAIFKGSKNGLITGYYLQANINYGSYTSSFAKEIKDISLSSDVKTLGMYCFNNLTSLTNINLENVIAIEEGAFSGCNALLLDTIPDNIVIEKRAFQNCKKITVNKLPSATTVLDEYTFDGCSAISSFTINDNVNIESAKYCFQKCTSLTNIKIPSNATKIPSYFLNGVSNLTEINLPDTLTSIDNDAFQNCNKLVLNSLPNSLTAIGSGAFQNCSLISISELPSSITTISGYTFENCKKITNMKVLGNIKSFALYCFRNSGLTTLSIPNVTVVPTGGNAIFQETPIDKGTGSIYVPDALVENFKSATNWSNYADVIKPISEMEV